MPSVDEIYPAKPEQLIVDLRVTALIFMRVLDQITMIVPFRVLEEDINLPIIGKSPKAGQFSVGPVR